MFDLKGKTAFVTGAAQGIGRAVVDLYAAAGAAVTAVDLNADKLSEFDGVDNVTTAAVDVTDDKQLCDAINKCKPNVLANVAGVVHHGDLLGSSADELDFAYRLNIRAIYVACQAALPHMLENEDGCIINISSVASSLRGVPVRCVYCTTKAGSIGLTKSIAIDYAKKKIRCNAICPGTVRTPSWEGRVGEMARREGISEEEALQRFIDRQMMGRLGTPEEIAGMCGYLASDYGVFVTGQALCIDGGWSI